MSARISRGLRIACAIGLAASLAGACSWSTRNAPSLRAITRPTFSNQRSGISSSKASAPLRLTSIKANATGNAPHATLTMSWSDGVNVRRACIRPSLSGNPRPSTTSVSSLSSISSRSPGTDAGRHRWSASSRTPAHRHCAYLRRQQRPPPPQRQGIQPVLRGFVDANTGVATTPHQKRQTYPLCEAPLERTVSSY